MVLCLMKDILGLGLEKGQNWKGAINFKEFQVHLKSQSLIERGGRDLFNLGKFQGFSAGIVKRLKLFPWMPCAFYIRELIY